MRPRRKYLSVNSLSLIGIPKKFHETALSDFETGGNKDLCNVKDFIKGYLTSLSVKPLSSMGGICFFGSNGVGKTMLSCIVAKEAYACRYSVRRVTFIDYMGVYTRMWGAKSLDEKEAAEDELYTGYKAIEVLVLEEVGKEVDSKASAPILEDLLRYREDKGLVTILCFNLSLKDIQTRYGASISSLLQGNTTPIKLVGVDKRKAVFDKRV